MRSVHRAAVVCLVPALFFSVTASASATTQPPATTPKPAAQGAPPPLTKLVMTGKGYIKENIRRSVGDRDTLIRVNWPNLTGVPHSCSFYSLGKQDVDPLRFMAYMKTRAEAFVYMGTAGIEGRTPDVAKGARLPSIALGEGDLALLVTADSPCCFMVQDESRKHPGSALYGAFQDGAGELWMYEEDLGPFFTDPRKFISPHCDEMVKVSLANFRANLDLYLDIVRTSSGGSGSASGAPCPAKYASGYTVGVNHHVDSGIKVQKGDKISVRASGEVTFGIMAGSGGPEGINFFPSYNYFQNLNHGCLIGRIAQSRDSDDPWSYLGASADFTADRSGELQFNVNDNDPDNNVGEFRVEITVCKQH